MRQSYIQELGLSGLGLGVLVRVVLELGVPALSIIGLSVRCLRITGRRVGEILLASLSLTKGIFCWLRWGMISRKCKNLGVSNSILEILAQRVVAWSEQVSKQASAKVGSRNNLDCYFKAVIGDVPCCCIFQ